VSNGLIGAGSALLGGGGNPAAYGQAGLAFTDAMQYARHEEEQRKAAEAKYYAQQQREFSLQQQRDQQAQLAQQRESRLQAEHDARMGAIEASQQESSSMEQAEQQRIQSVLSQASELLGPEKTKQFNMIREGSGMPDAVKWGIKQLEPEDRDWVVRSIEQGGLVRVSPDTGEIQTLREPSGGPQERNPADRMPAGDPLALARARSPQGQTDEVDKDVAEALQASGRTLTQQEAASLDALYERLVGAGMPKDVIVRHALASLGL